MSASETSHALEANKNAVSPRGSFHQSAFQLSPGPPLSPVSFGDDTKIHKRASGLSQLQVSAELHLLVAIFTEGTVALCNISGKCSKQGTEITPERWVGVFDAVCSSIAHDQQYLAVGTRRGSVEIFNLADCASYLRTISLVDWG